MRLAASRTRTLPTTRKTLDLSQARLDAGDITKTDFERIDLQLAQFESDADNAALNYQQASAQLQVLFGVQKPGPDAAGGWDAGRA